MEKEGDNLLIFKTFKESDRVRSLPDGQTGKDQTLEAKIKAVLRGIDENNLELIASLLVSIMRHQIKDRLVLTTMSVVTGMFLGALVFLLMRR